jgi:hypothetical protein
MLCIWAAIARSGSLRVDVPGAAFAASCSLGRGLVPDVACFGLFGWCAGLVPSACYPACLLVCCWKSSCSA